MRGRTEGFNKKYEFSFCVKERCFMQVILMRVSRSMTI